MVQVSDSISYVVSLGFLLFCAVWGGVGLSARIARSFVVDVRLFRLASVAVVSSGFGPGEIPALCGLQPLWVAACFALGSFDVVCVCLVSSLISLCGYALRSPLFAFL